MLHNPPSLRALKLQDVLMKNADGKLCEDPWKRLAREHCNWDHGKIADAFRPFCAGKNIRLEAKNIEDLFITFCKKQPRI